MWFDFGDFLVFDPNYGYDSSVDSAGCIGSLITGGILLAVIGTGILLDFAFLIFPFMGPNVHPMVILASFIYAAVIWAPCICLCLFGTIAIRNKAYIICATPITILMTILFLMGPSTGGDAWLFFIPIGLVAAYVPTLIARYVLKSRG